MKFSEASILIFIGPKKWLLRSRMFFNYLCYTFQSLTKIIYLKSRYILPVIFFFLITYRGDRKSCYGSDILLLAELDPLLLVWLNGKESELIGRGPSGQIPGDQS